MRKRFDPTKPCSWCNTCSASFCDCGPCTDQTCRVCHKCTQCKEYETGVEGPHGQKEIAIEPCEDCLVAASLKNVENFGQPEEIIWMDEDSEGAGGDR